MRLDVGAPSVQSGVLLAAFWIAIWMYRGREPFRFVIGLLLGCIGARLGWAFFHLPAVAQHPASILGDSAGYSVLFFPLGLLLVSRVADSWRALPLALAVARLGCAVVGCCSGVSAPWGVHPVALYDLLLLVALHRVLQRLDDRAVGPVFCMGFGLVRILVEPFRAVPPLGEPLVDPAFVALAWLVLGGAWAWASIHRIDSVSSRCGVAAADKGLPI